MNIQRKNSAHHFRMQSECKQTVVRTLWLNMCNGMCSVVALPAYAITRPLAYGLL